MCGIVALWRRGGRPVTAAEVSAMRDLLAHRGPDGAGLHLDGQVGLGHRRLAIIDLEGGQQPMASNDGAVHLTFNGEIYNYEVLRATLRQEGVPLRFQGDIETILGLYDLYGADCVDHLCGMFTFVIWDSRRHRLLVARDRLGIKPLYVFRHGATVAFASEIKAFQALEEFVPRVNDEALAEYLTHRNLAGRRTLFRDVEHVLPGERFVIDRDGERRERYWQLPQPTDAAVETGTTATWAEEAHDLLDRAVGDHMVSDVPIGTFNSGGLDSSLVTALVAKRGDEHLNTYSVGFREAAFDESPYADLVAERWGTQHHKLYVRGEDEYADLLPRAVWHHDEPLNHPHSVHLLYLSHLARRRVKVVLTGEGADELFAGYPRYRFAALIDRLPLRSTLLLAGLRLAAGLRRGKERLRVRAVLGGGGVCLGNLAAFVAPEQVAGFLTPRLRDVPDPRATALPRGAAALPAALWIDQQTYLQSLLLRMDKMSMAASLEGRVPFLDHRVVELAARVPPDLKLHGGRETKYLLKSIARRHLPAAIIDRTKAGFAVPISAWLRPGGPLATYLDALETPRSLDRGVFDPAALRSCIAAHRDGRHDHGELLWGAVNLELWQRLLIDGDALPAAATVDLTPTAPADADRISPEER